MATYTVEQIYDYLRFGECGNFVQFQCKQRTVTIRRLTRVSTPWPTALLRAMESREKKSAVRVGTAD